MGKFKKALAWIIAIITLVFGLGSIVYAISDIKEVIILSIVIFWLILLNWASKQF